MTLPFDLSSVFSVISITVVAGWIGSFLSLRKDERKVQMEQITKERTKWRDGIRKLTVEIIATYYAHKQSGNEEQVASCRGKLATVLNPKEMHDNEIL